MMLENEFGVRTPISPSASHLLHSSQAGPLPGSGLNMTVGGGGGGGGGSSSGAAATVPAPPVDELGLEPYMPIYDPKQNVPLPSSVHQDFQRRDNVVPWELRSTDSNLSCPAFHFLATRNFWERFEGAVRVALVGILPAAALLNSTWLTGAWVSQTFIISGTLIALGGGRETIGLQIAYLGQYIRPAFIWVGILCAETALHLYDYTAAWFLVYFFCNFLMAAMMEGYARRVGMLLFTIGTMNMVRSQSSDVTIPLRICLEWLIGSGFGFAAALLPWPVFSKTRAEAHLQQLSLNLSTGLKGLASSFWVDSNLTRNIQMVRVRYVMRRVEEDLLSSRKHLDDALYEWMFEALPRRRLRQMKGQLYLELFRNINAIRRVIEIVRDRPFILAQSERAQLFGQRLGKRIEAVCSTVEELLRVISAAQSRRKLLQTPLFDYLASVEEELQTEFQQARIAYFYETKLDHLEEFVPLMTFYVFCVDQICLTLLRMRETVRRDLHETQDMNYWKENLTFGLIYFKAPLRETLARAKDFLFRRNDDDIRIIVEALKVSAAMVASLGFYVYMDSSTAFLSGPTVIAFIASSNPSEALISSLPRLTGTLAGVVLGFFIATTATDQVSRVAGLVTLVFVSRLVSHVKNIGVALSYSAFIAVSQLSITPLSQGATMNRIQQSTFAVFIYIFITLFVFPCRPTTLLRRARGKAIIGIAVVYKQIMDIFTETADAFANNPPEEDAREGANSTAPFGNEEGAANGSTTMRPAFALNTTVKITGGSFSSYIEFPREALESIETQLRRIDREISNSHSLMAYAADEPRMTTVAYPTRACEDAQTALKKSVDLLRTMLLSVRLLRERRVPPSREMIGLFRNLVGCARDTTFETQRFAHLLAALIEDRRLDLTPEIMKSSHVMSHLCTLFHRRKSFIFLKCIQRAVARGGTASGEGVSQSAAPDKADEQEEQRWLQQQQELPLTESPADCSGEALRAALTAYADFETSPVQYHGNTAEAWEPTMPRPQPRVSKVVTMSPTFQIPVTTQDAEGVHTLTFSVVLFASEMRKLLVAAEDLLQHRQGK